MNKYCSEYSLGKIPLRERSLHFLCTMTLAVYCALQIDFHKETGRVHLVVQSSLGLHRLQKTTMMNAPDNLPVHIMQKSHFRVRLKPEVGPACGSETTGLCARIAVSVARVLGEWAFCSTVTFYV